MDVPKIPQPGAADSSTLSTAPAFASAASSVPNWMLALATFVEVVPFFGKPLAEMLRKGAWHPFALVLVILWIFVVYPLLVPLLASTYLNKGLLGSWHQPYAESVRRAFKVEELVDVVAERGNLRLDYFHSIDISRSAHAPHTFPFSVQQDQRMILRPLSTVLRTTDAKRCPVPLPIARQGNPVFDVRVGNVQVGTFRYGSNQPPIIFEAGVWDKLRSAGIDDRLFVRLDPVPDLARIGCPELLSDVHFTVEVYKDLVPGLSAKNTPVQK